MLIEAHAPPEAGPRGSKEGGGICGRFFVDNGAL